MIGYFDVFFRFTLFPILILYSFIISLIGIPISSNSALSLLSSLVQGQAAILAIGIGVDYIVMQLISSKYSTRVPTRLLMEKHKNLWIIYGLSILYSLFLILVCPQTIDFSYTFFLLGAVVFSIVAFWYLLTFISLKMNFLSNSESLIDLLDQNEKENHSLILDFIMSSIHHRDIGLYEKCLSLFHHKDLDPSYISEDKNTFSKVLSDFMWVGDMSIEINNEKAIESFYNQVRFIFFNLKPNERKSEFISNLGSLYAFLDKLAKKDLIESAIIGLKLNDMILEQILADFPEYSLEDNGYLLDDVQYPVLLYMLNFGKTCSDLKHEEIVVETLDYIGSIIDDFLTKGNELNIKYLEKISFIGITCAKNMLPVSLEKIMSILEVILLSSDDKEIVSLTIDMIGKVAIVGFENGFYSPVDSALNSYQLFETRLLGFQHDSEALTYNKINNWKRCLAEMLGGYNVASLNMYV